MTDLGDQISAVSKILPLRSLLVALSFLSSLLLAPCSATQAQQAKKLPRIGYLLPGNPASESTGSEAIRLALRELGYIEGQNIALEYRYAEGKSNRDPELAAELVRLKVDVLVVAGGNTPVRAVKMRPKRFRSLWRAGPIRSRQVWWKALPVPAATSPASQAFPEN